jgi:hypothetical protein
MIMEESRVMVRFDQPAIDGIRRATGQKEGITIIAKGRHGQRAYRMMAPENAAMINFNRTILIINKLGPVRSNSGSQASGVGWPPEVGAWVLSMA